jgi:MYXO-CTERM domain-containing protein
MANRTRTATIRTSLFVLALGAVAGRSSDAPAEWPPPESATPADLKKPENWPDDPGYGFLKPDGSDQNGQWMYFSFIPDQVPGSVLRPEETASGMSVDLAWRYTTGDDRVVIAVTDSGIEWDHHDLVDRHYLNRAELVTHKPTNADGSACGGSGDLDGFDCNGDGILSVSDYVDTPTLQPAPVDGRPLGDVNQNGILDPGDLIGNFSDGIDDDGNGYVDDISGWDFFKDDNNPYDDTRYGHGTMEARDATSTANNGRGEAGACPNCRTMAMRVGDSFITDVQQFAEAVVYATDNGVSVVQCALGTVNNTRFAQQALDYAYANGTLVVASMADENSRHHNMPVTSNHTLPVHAIRYKGNKANNTLTFEDFNGCTNFGGQNFLSASGTSCSSEAVAHLSGMSGLLYSAALKYQVAPALTAGEAQQLWLMSADDIDVPESRSEEDNPYYWSQPGFDQRFGYGRVNANSAVEMIKDGKIPPAVDVTSPHWFRVLYRDQLSDAVEIQGTVSAKRATSYDYVVEWAPGVQPTDDLFTTLASEENVPATVVSGSDEPLALFDVRTIETDHEPDADSVKFGENRYTVTVRVRALAHYGGDVGDVRGEMRRTYAVHSDPTLVKGFPIYLGDSSEGSGKMADIDGDGRRDLVWPTSGGEVFAWKITPDGPQVLSGFPFRSLRRDGLRDTPLMDKPNYLGSAAYDSGDVDPALGRDGFVNVPAVADLDDDGKLEIVVTSYGGNIYVINSDGQLRSGWPVRLPDVPSCPRDGSMLPPLCESEDSVIDRGAFASPVLADMDKDGDLDIIQSAFDGRVYVYDRDGQLLPGWPVRVHYPGGFLPEPRQGRVFTTPGVGDFNDDGYPDVLVGSNETLGGKDSQNGAVYLIDGRGTNAPTPYFDNWPVTMTSLALFPLVSEGVTNSGVVGRFDGTLSAVIHGNANSPFIMPADPGAQGALNQLPPNALPVREDPETGELERGVVGSAQFGELSKAFRPNTMFPLFGQPSLGDIDQDGQIDVVASGSSLNIAINLQGGAGDLPGEHMVSVWNGKTGAMLDAAPFLLEDFSFFNSHAIADIDNDDYPEVLVGSAGYFLHAFNGCGREPEGWPKFTGQWITSTPAVGDLDGDGTLEVAVATRSGWLYAWHTEGSSEGVIEWESYHHDNLNSGNFDTPLDQGDPNRQAAKPLDLEMCRPPAPANAATLTPSGGCGDCTIGNADERGGRRGAAWGGLLLGLAIAWRRRRRAA